MIILDKPYVSPLLEETVLKNNYAVLNNEALKDLNLSKDIRTLNDEEAVDAFKNGREIQLYSNSENSINWIAKNLSFSELPKKIELFKDKVKFRQLLKEIYPDFYFEEIKFEDLKKIDPDTLKTPFILKPAVGFLSFGVYVVNNKDEWSNIIENIDSDIEKFKGQFPLEVVDSSKFIIEEIIEGEEFAVDAYFDKEGKPVILNIFQHPFSSAKDVSDRIYFSSKKIITQNLERFEKLLTQIGQLSNLKNFPMHLELRVKDGKIVPIEINPMRFAGWCVTDLAYFAYGINVYEYYFEQKKPDWNKIFENIGDEVFYFTIAEVPMDADKSSIKNMDADAFVLNIEHPLEVRKIDFRKHPIFAIAFAKTNDQSEIDSILKKDMKEFIRL